MTYSRSPYLWISGWVVALVVAGAVAGAVVLRSNFGTTNQVKCVTQFGPCPEALQAYLVGPPAQIRAQIGQLTHVKSVKVYRRLPSTLVVDVSLRQAAGTIAPSVLGTSSLVDEQGVVFDHATSSSLPLLIQDPLPLVGETVGLPAQKALQMLSHLSPLLTGRAVGTLAGSILKVWISQATQVELDIDHSPAGWPASLQFVLTRSKIDGKIPSKIDLKFNHPMVTYR